MDRRPTLSACSARPTGARRSWRQTIDSVIAQTYPDWELIVVDNGMSDEIAEIVRRYLARSPGPADPPAQPPADRWHRDRRARRRPAATWCRWTATTSCCPSSAGGWPRCSAERPEIDALSCDAYLFRRRLRTQPGALVPAAPDRTGALADHRRHGRPARRHARTSPRSAGRPGSPPAATPPGTEMVEDIGLFLRLIASGHDVRVLPERLVRYRLRDDSVVPRPELGRGLRPQPGTDLLGRPPRPPGTRRRWRCWTQRLRGLRYEQALRRARWAFLQRRRRRRAGRGPRRLPAAGDRAQLWRCWSGCSLAPACCGWSTRSSGG